MTENATMDRAGAIKAGGEALLGFWFEETLAGSLPFSEDQSNEERELRIAAAREAVAQLAPAEAGLGARMIALQFVCSHTAGLDYQAKALSDLLPPDARRTSQRFANQLMGLSCRQLGVLGRLEAERRREADAAARRAHLDREYAWKHDVTMTRALAGAMDRFVADPAAMAAAIGGGPLDLRPTAGAPRGEAPPAAADGTGIGPVPETDPLTRQQRRAMERRERKQARRAAANGAAKGAA